MQLKTFFFFSQKDGMGFSIDPGCCYDVMASCYRLRPTIYHSHRQSSTLSRDLQHPAPSCAALWPLTWLPFVSLQIWERTVLFVDPHCATFVITLFWTTFTLWYPERTQMFRKLDLSQFEITFNWAKWVDASAIFHLKTEKDYISETLCLTEY